MSQAPAIRNSNSPVERKNYMGKLLDSKKQELVALLGNSEEADRFRANAIAFLGDPNLQNCSVDSIYMSAYNIARLQLAPQKELGQAYVVPRQGQATMQLGYKGWNVLAARSGLRTDARLVFKCDHFLESADENGPTVEYRANRQEHKVSDRTWVEANIEGALVWIYENGQRPLVKFVHIDTLRKLQKASQQSMGGKTSPAWQNWLEEMYLAKALKYVLSKLPIDHMRKVALYEAIAEEEKGIDYNETTFEPVEPDILPVDIETGEVIDVK